MTGRCRSPQPLTLRGAGELTRIRGGLGRPISISVAADERVVLDSLRLERGEAEDGGGMLVTDGDVHLRNIHIHWCGAHRLGGAIAVLGGRVVASNLHTDETSALRGGAVWIGHDGHFSLRDSRLARCEAEFGGAIALEDGAVVVVDGLTVQRAWARSSRGGQAIYIRAGATGRLQLERVRLDGDTIGHPLVVDPMSTAEVFLRSSDVPRAVRGVTGLVDGGANHWR